MLKGAAEKPPRASATKPTTGKLKELKRKGICPYGYSFHIAKEDLGSDAFMRELRAMESRFPGAREPVKGFTYILINLARFVQSWTQRAPF